MALGVCIHAPPATSLDDLLMPTCTLCRETRTILDSHLIPAWAYKRAMEDGNKSVTVRDGSATWTSAHLREHMLCEACEALVRNDETVVAGLSYQRNGSLPLRQYLEPIDKFDGQLARIGEIDAAPLGRFTASVLWRVSSAEANIVPSLTMRKRHVEQLRKFLLGTSPLPQFMAFTLVVLEPDERLPELGGLSGAPATALVSPDGRHSAHDVLISGLQFRLSIGSYALPLKQHCLCGPTPAAMVVPWDETGYMKKLREKIGMSTPRGGFAKGRTR